MSSRSAMARANFKQYTEITNPLSSSQPKKSEGKSAGGGSGSGSGGSSRREELVGDEDDEEEEEDPFGLGTIMSKDDKGSPEGHHSHNHDNADAHAEDDAYDDADQEEEDPFGLGRIMGTNSRKGVEGGGGAGRNRENIAGAKTSALEAQQQQRSSVGSKSKRGNTPPSTGDGSSSTTTSGGRGTQNGNSESSRKAQKTTGGYFSGMAASSSARDHGNANTTNNNNNDGHLSAAAVAAAAAASEAKRRPFLPAASFEGPRAGYAFQKGRSGLGYYADKVYAAGVAASVAAATRARGGSDESGRDGRPEGGRGTAAAGAEAAADAGGAGTKRPPVDVSAAAKKLGGLLLKPKKTAKAASLMADLMQAEMRPENARLFFRALKPLAEAPAGEAALAAGEGGARAFRLLAGKATEWLGGAAEGVRVVTWELLFGLRQDVKTDDSFQFARSIKRLRQAIEALGDITGGSGAEAGDGGDATEAGDGGASLALERKQAVILIMKEAFRSYHLAWARSSIEPAFKAAADRRRLFPEGEMRETLDGFTDTITKRQRNPGGAMAPPTRSVRAHNSMAHPMLNKRSDIIR